MTQKSLKNVAASVQQRLLNLSKKRGEDFHFVLIQYALERFLYRLAISEYRDAFILKGAFLFIVWGGEQHLHTKDMDFLYCENTDIPRLEDIFKEITAIQVDDGLDFISVTAREVTPTLPENGVHDEVQKPHEIRKWARPGSNQ